MRGATTRVMTTSATATVDTEPNPRPMGPVNATTSRAPIPVAEASTVVSKNSLAVFLVAGATGRKMTSLAALCTECRKPPSAPFARVAEIRPGTMTIAAAPSPMATGRIMIVNPTPADRSSSGVPNS